MLGDARHKCYGGLAFSVTQRRVYSHFLKSSIEFTGEP